MATSIFTRLSDGVATASADETRELAAEFARALPADATLALHGDLGVGKTTFVQGLARGFNIPEPVISPTFNLYTLHRGPERLLLHLDAYRIENPRQIEDLLLDDFMVSPWCLAVEWPDKISAWLPERRVLHLDLGIRNGHHHFVQLRPVEQNCL